MQLWKIWLWKPNGAKFRSYRIMEILDCNQRFISLSWTEIWSEINVTNKMLKETRDIRHVPMCVCICTTWVSVLKYDTEIIARLCTSQWYSCACIGPSPPRFITLLFSVSRTLIIHLYPHNVRLSLTVRGFPTSFIFFFTPFFEHLDYCLSFGPYSSSPPSFLFISPSREKLSIVRSASMSNLIIVMFLRSNNNDGASLISTYFFGSIVVVILFFSFSSFFIFKSLFFFFLLYLFLLFSLFLPKQVSLDSNYRLVNW